jgi:signal transduction histidine kinase
MKLKHAMSKFVKYKSPLFPILIAVLLALILLATLQYHWVGQVSQGQHERMQASLQTGAVRFSEDFDREIARIYLNFQMDAATLRDKDWDRYTQRYDSWFTTAPYPGLVRDVYLVKVNEIGRLSYSRFNLEAEEFESMVWPDELAEVREYFERAYRQDLEDKELAMGSAFDVDPDAPALIIPLSREWLLSDSQYLDISADLIFSDTVLPPSQRICPSCRPSIDTAPLLAHTIVYLDLDYLKKVFIPDLVERNFPGVGSDYNMAIVSQGRAGEVVYQTDPDLPASVFAVSDSTTDIFSIRFEELNRLLFPHNPDQEGQLGDVETPERIAVGIIGAPNENDGHWDLLLKHKSGSLEAAVSELRTRNLIISFSILLILATSVALMLVATQRTQRLAKQQMDFAAAVSHELRTPLAVICAAGENLADGLIHDPNKARQYGSVIRGEGRRLTEMVEQVLDFASAQSGRKTYQLRPTEVNGLIESALTALHAQLSEGGFVVEKDFRNDLPLVMADESALKRAIQNLLNNAIKYSGTSRWIGVWTRVAAGPHAPEVQITVRDRGIGIAPSDLPHIFEPFYRGQAVTMAQIHGSGLGLSLVKHTIDSLNGRISVDSTPGQGVVFTLHLPALLEPMGMQPATIRSHRLGKT